MIIQLFYHGDFATLKFDALSALPNEDWNDSEWYFTNGYSVHILDGYRVLFKEQNHSLGLSFKGNSKKTKARLEKMASRLKSNSKFNDTPCGDILCQHYNFSTKRKGSIPDSKPIVIYDPYSPTEEPATKKQHRYN